MTTPEETITEDADVGEAPDALAEIRARLDGLAGYVEKADEFRRLRERDAEFVDQLHRENDELRKDQLTQAMWPLFQGYIKLYDLMTAAPAGDETTPMLIRQLVQILDMNGVTVYEPEPGETFDGQWQEGIPVDTVEPDAAGTIACLRRAGFRRSTTVLRVAQVEVYRLARPADSATAQ
ncbi:molecular chaperone GrpE (heat shock protein) [Actinoplanes octamycinicus]|uniref:Molecular chaperone GrpE (Heat shock protein) n=1 Tax=Actinoplanes octamycinicus TaxID=135948 RepID=A0A7W7H0K1_9ACTN|nr:nucleotide exchange factor GrpE [Actinoplanes octamycinicus]MBB4741547.1 molecular chaperone GrpE (heat shock protein) [Actinoplanes octamycinicus]GIE57099.1 hypothetical protein Aoc01nite_25010 [Actinoplanes octamycinicus]